MFSVVCICRFTKRDPHVTNDAIDQSQIIRTPTLPTLTLGPDTQSLAPDMSKLVHYVAQASVSKQAVGIRPKCFLITARSSCGKFMFSQASVILFTEGCVSQHALGLTPPGQTPPRQTHTPPWQTHLLPRRHPPPEQTPSLGRHPALGRHPPWADRRCSGPYASYWNVFLS